MCSTISSPLCHVGGRIQETFWGPPHLIDTFVRWSQFLKTIDSIQAENLHFSFHIHTPSHFLGQEWPPKKERSESRVGERQNPVRTSYRESFCRKSREARRTRDWNPRLFLGSLTKEILTNSESPIWCSFEIIHSNIFVCAGLSITKQRKSTKRTRFRHWSASTRACATGGFYGWGKMSACLGLWKSIADKECFPKSESKRMSEETLWPKSFACPALRFGLSC